MIDDGRDGTAAFEKAQDAAKDGEDEESDETLVTSGLAGSVAEISANQEERRRDNGGSIGLVHILVAASHEPHENDQDGDVGGCRQQSKEDLEIRTTKSCFNIESLRTPLWFKTR